MKNGFAEVFMSGLKATRTSLLKCQKNKNASDIFKLIKRYRNQPS